MNNVFVYGTLLNDEVLNLIVDSAFFKQKAKLPEFRRVCVQGEVYPAIFPSQGCVVDGVLISSLSKSDLGNLDAYEGACYQRTSVSVELAKGKFEVCDTYVFKPEYYDLLSDAEWNNDCFRSEYLQQFLNRFI